MPINLYPSVAKVKRNNVFHNLPGFVPQSGDDAAQAMIANSETSTIAQFPHPKDSYFRLNDTLYQADKDIPVNGTIAVGTNCHVAVLGNDVYELIDETTSQSEKIDELKNALSDNTNVTAGHNEISIDTGSWSGNGVTFTYNSDGTVIVNGTPSQNSSAFISTAQLLPAGEYIVQDGLSTHDLSVRITVFTNTDIAHSNGESPGNTFTLTTDTNIRLIVFCRSGYTFNNLIITPKVVNLIALSNEELTKSVSPLIGYDSNIINNAIKMGYYPWAVSAPLNNDLLEFYNAVKGIRIYGGTRNDNYAIRQCFIASTALSPTCSYITIYRVRDSVKVCEYYQAETPTNRTTIHFNSFNNSGITADLDIDFSVLQRNHTYPVNDINTLVISKSCIIIDSNVDILIPDTIYGVVGIESCIYWDNAIRVSDINSVIVQSRGTGLNLGDRWSYTPNEATTFDFTVNVRDKKDYRLLGTKVIHYIASIKSATAKVLNVIHLGDSMIDNNYHLDWLSDEMTGSNITYNILGTRTHSEGRGGWTSSQYLGAGSQSVPNPFYNPTTQAFDFSYYMQNQGYSNLDAVFISLGTNDARGASDFVNVQDAARVVPTNFKTIIDSIHAYNSSIKIIICLPAVGAETQYPFATNNSTNQPKSLFKYMMQLICKNIYASLSNITNVYILAVGNSVDPKYGYPMSSVNASSRITTQITVQTDPYHPTSEGYHQFADCEFGFIRNVLAT